MTNSRIISPIPLNGTMSFTIARNANLASAHAWTVPTTSICSYTVPAEQCARCAPLSEGAVRIGNSLLTTFVPETAIRRDEGGDF